MATDNVFSVEQARAFSDAHYALGHAVKEGWSPGEGDAEALFALSPDGFFMSKLDGRNIGSTVLFMFNPSHAYVWLFVVEKPYRGRGYGSETFTAALASLDSSCNVSLDAVEDRVPFYQRMGFNPAWGARRYKFKAESLSGHLSSTVIPVGICIKSLAEIDFPSLASYDDAVFGEPRHAWLKKWISVPSSCGWAAITAKGEVVGYIASQMAATNKSEISERRIRPVLANSRVIAKCLLKALVDFLLCTTAVKSLSTSEDILADVPIEGNTEAAQLCKELGGTEMYSFVKMYTRDSKQDMQRVFVCFP